MLQVARSRMQQARQSRSKPKRPDETLERHVKNLIGRFPTFGYRRIWAMLRREGVMVNKKTVYRVLKYNGWFVTQRVATPRPRAAGRVSVADTSNVRSGNGCDTHLLWSRRLGTSGGDHRLS